MVAFQNQYKRTFGEEIDLQAAEAELSKLARLVETIIPKVNQKRIIEKGVQE